MKNHNKKIKTMILSFFILISLVFTINGTNAFTNKATISDIELPDGLLLTNVTLWESVTVVANASIELQTNANLTILNSIIDFNNSKFGFIVENNSFLMIKNSTVKNGGSAILGKTNGTVMIINSVFDNFSADTVKLKKDYKTTIKGSTFMNGGSDGVQLEKSAFQANITDTVFKNMNKDGIKGEFMALSVDNVIIQDMGDEGIQLEGTTYFSISNSFITRTGGTGMKATFIEGDIILKNVTITDVTDDAFQVSVGKDISISDSEFSGSDENGFETDNTGSITITATKFNNNIINGIEAINVTSLEIVKSVFSNNKELGLYLKNVSSIKVFNSTIDSNKMGGIFISQANSATLNYNSIKDNNVFSINATENNLALEINAKFNYWGTNNASNVGAIGNVNTTPILDSSFKEYIDSDPTTTNLSFLPFVLGLLTVLIFSKKRNRK